MLASFLGSAGNETTEVLCSTRLASFPPPVFDHLQYKNRGEGLGERVTCVTSGRRILQAIKNWRRERPGNEASTRYNLASVIIVTMHYNTLSVVQ